jgi:hypothetical protein
VLLDDKLKKRELERRLAVELHRAKEAYRLAVQRRYDLATLGAYQSTPAPDSNLQITQAIAECERTRKAFELALDRWKRFVIEGEDPDESLESSSVAGA